jgi:hypothetical protein
MDANETNTPDGQEESDTIGIGAVDVDPHGIEKIESKTKGEELTYLRLSGEGLRMHLVLPDEAVDELRAALPEETA